MILNRLEAGAARRLNVREIVFLKEEAPAGGARL
jgi:hypothetical protein